MRDKIARRRRRGILHAGRILDNVGVDTIEDRVHTLAMSSIPRALVVDGESVVDVFDIFRI